MNLIFNVNCKIKTIFPIIKVVLTESTLKSAGINWNVKIAGYSMQLRFEWNFD